MKGVAAYDCSQWHKDCPGCIPVFNGVGLWLWCPSCKQLCNLEAVSPKLDGFGADAKSPGSAKAIPSRDGNVNANLETIVRAVVAVMEAEHAAHS